MAISFHCPQCGKPYTTSDDTAGKRARCRDCGNIMAIPRPATRDPYALAEPPAPPPRGFDDEDEVLPPRAAYRPRKSKASESSGSGKVVGGVASVFGVLAIIAVRIVLRLALSNVGGKGHKAPEPLPPPPVVAEIPAAPAFQGHGDPAPDGLAPGPAGPVPVPQPVPPTGPIPPNEPTSGPVPPANPAPGIGGFPQPPPNHGPPGPMRPPGFRGPRFRRPPGARPF